jgi:hypothetical protein
MIMILLGAGLAGAIIPDRGIAARGLTEHTDVEHPEKATQPTFPSGPGQTHWITYSLLLGSRS